MGDYIYRCPECKSTHVRTYTQTSLCTEYSEGVDINRTVVDVYETTDIECAKCGHRVTHRDEGGFDSFHDCSASSEIPDKMICIYRGEEETPYVTCVAISPDESPVEVINRWAEAQWRDSLGDETMTLETYQEMKAELQYFWVDPKVGRIVHAVYDDADNDGEYYVVSNLRYQICRAAEITE